MPKLLKEALNYVNVFHLLLLKTEMVLVFEICPYQRQVCVYPAADTMAADDLAMQGASALTAMVLI